MTVRWSHPSHEPDAVSVDMSHTYLQHVSGSGSSALGFGQKQSDSEQLRNISSALSISFRRHAVHKDCESFT